MKSALWLNVFVFGLSNLGWTQVPLETAPATRLAVSIPLEVKIPYQLGSLQSIRLFPKADRFIIFIQDAHAVLDAQNHMQRLIKYFQKEYGIDLVFFEGGKGKLDPMLFRAFPDEAVKKKVFKGYLEKGELTGTESAAVMNPVEARFYGIEDWELYKRNYFAYLRAARNKETIFIELSRLKNRLDDQRREVYSESLNTYHQKLMAFREEQSDLLQLLMYLKDLKRTREELVKYPQLSKLFDALDQRRLADEKEMDASIRRLAQKFKKRNQSKFSRKKLMAFNSKYQSFVTGSLEGARFLKFLINTSKRFGKPMPLSPAMQELLTQRQTLSSIKGTGLFDDLEKLLASIEETLITSPGEREIAEKYKKIILLKDLASLEVDHDQLAKYTQYAPDYNALLSKPALLDPAVEFYRCALDRDRALHRNLMAGLMKENARAAVVVAGGFHTKGLETALTADGVSYAMITPRITSLRGHEHYHEIMQGKLSFKDYLRSSFYDAFARDAALKLVAGLNEPDFRHVLKLWRDRIIRKLAEKGQAGKAGEYTRYIDLLIKSYMDKFGTDKIASNNKEQIWENVRKEIGELRQNALERAKKRFEFQLRELLRGMRGLTELRQLDSDDVSELITKINRESPGALSPAQTRLARGLNASDQKFLVDLVQDNLELPEPAAAVAASLGEEKVFGLKQTPEGISVLNPDQGIRSDTLNHLESFFSDANYENYGLSDFWQGLERAVVVPEEEVMEIQGNTLTLSESSLDYGGDRQGREKKLRDLLFINSPQAQNLRVSLIKQEGLDLSDDEAQALAIALRHINGRFFNIWNYGIPIEESRGLDEAKIKALAFERLAAELSGDPSALPYYLRNHSEALARAIRKMDAGRLSNILKSVEGYFWFRQRFNQAVTRMESSATQNLTRAEEVARYRKDMFGFISLIEQDSGHLKEWNDLLSQIAEQLEEDKVSGEDKSPETFLQFIAEHIFSGLEKLPEGGRTFANYKRLIMVFFEGYRKLPPEVRGYYLQAAGKVFESFDGDESLFWDELGLIRQMMLSEYQKTTDLETFSQLFNSYRLEKYPAPAECLHFLQVHALLLEHGLVLYHSLEDYIGAQTSGSQALKILPVFIKTGDGKWVLSVADAGEEEVLRQFTAWLEGVTQRAVTYEKTGARQTTAELRLGPKQIQPQPVPAFQVDLVRAQADSNFRQRTNRKTAATRALAKPQDAFHSLGILAKVREFYDAAQNRGDETIDLRDLTDLGKLYDGRPSAGFFEQAEARIEAEHANAQSRIDTRKKSHPGDRGEQANYDKSYLNALLNLGKILLESGLHEDGERVLNKAYLYMEGLFYFPGAGERRNRDLLMRNAELLNFVLQISGHLIVNDRAAGENYFNFAAGFSPDAFEGRYRPFGQTAVHEMVSHLWKKYQEAPDAQTFDRMKRIVEAWETNVSQDVKLTDDTFPLLDLYREIAENIAGQDAGFASFLRQRVDAIYVELWEKELIGLDSRLAYTRRERAPSKQESGLRFALAGYLRTVQKSDELEIEGQKYNIHDLGYYRVSNIRQTEGGVIVTYRIRAGAGAFVNYELTVPQEQLDKMTPAIFGEAKPADYLGFLWTYWVNENALYSMRGTPFRDDTFNKADMFGRNFTDVVLEEIVEHRPGLMATVFQSLENDLWPSYKKLEIINHIFDTVGHRMDGAAKARLFELWHDTLEKVSEVQLRMNQFDRVSEPHKRQWNHLTSGLTGVYLEEIRKYYAARIRLATDPAAELKTAGEELRKFEERYAEYSAALADRGSNLEIPVEMQVDDKMYQDEKSRSNAARRMMDSLMEHLPFSLRMIAEEEEKREEGMALVILDSSYVRLKFMSDMLRNLPPGTDAGELTDQLAALAEAVAAGIPGKFQQNNYWTKPQDQRDEDKEPVLLNHAQYGYQVLEESIQTLIQRGALDLAGALIVQLEKIREGFHRLESIIQKEKDEGRDVSTQANQWRIKRINRLKQVFSRGKILLTLQLAQKHFDQGEEETARALVRSLIQDMRSKPRDFTDPYKIYFAMELSGKPWLAAESETWFQYLIHNVKLIHKDPKQQLKQNDAIYNLSDAIHRAEGLSPETRQILLTGLFERIRKEMTPRSSSPTRDEEAQYLALQAVSLFRIYEIVHESDQYPELKTAILEHFYQKVRSFRYEQDIIGRQGKYVFEILKQLASITEKTHPDLTQEDMVRAVLDGFPPNEEAQGHLGTLFPEAVQDYIGQVDPVRLISEYTGDNQQKAIVSFYRLFVLNRKTDEAFKEAVMARVKQDLEQGKVPDEAFLGLLKAFVRAENEQTTTEALEAATNRAWQHYDRKKRQDIFPTSGDFAAHAPLTMFLFESFKSLVEQESTRMDMRALLLDALLNTESHEEAAKGAALYRDLLVLPNLTDDERERVFLKMLESGEEFSKKSNIRLEEEGIWNEYLESFYASEIRYNRWQDYTPEQRQAMESEAYAKRKRFLERLTAFMRIKNEFRRKVENMPMRPSDQTARDRSFEAMNSVFMGMLHEPRLDENGAFARDFGRAMAEFEKVFVSHAAYEFADSSRHEAAQAQGLQKYVFEGDPYDPAKTDFYTDLAMHALHGALDIRAQNYYGAILEKIESGELDSDPNFTPEIREAYQNRPAVDVGLIRDLAMLNRYLRRAPEPYLSDPHSPFYKIFLMRFSRLSPKKREKILDDFRNEKFQDIFSMEELMRRLAVINGVGDIKLGQVLSTRGDLIKNEKDRVEMAKLKDKVPAVPYDESAETREARLERERRREEPPPTIQQALKNAFPESQTVVLTDMPGKGINEQGEWEDPGLQSLSYREGVVFYRFWKEPIAVASIGQAHRAVIWDGEKFVEVIVKVLKPHAPQEVKEGRQAWLSIAAYVEANPERFPGVAHPTQHVNTIFDEIEKELRFTLERENLVEMAGIVDGETVLVPRAYEDVSRDTVLVMGRAKGVPIGKTPKMLRRQVAQKFIRTILDQMFTKGMYHADPHDRNVFTDENGVLTLIDLGMIGRLDEAAKNNFFEILFRVQQKDTDKIVEALRNMGVFPADFDAEPLKRQIAEIISDEDKGTVAQATLAQKLGATAVSEEQGEVVLSFGDLQINLGALARTEGGRVIFKPGLTEKEVAAFRFPQELKDKSAILANLFRESQKPVSRQIQKIFETASKNGLNIDSSYTIAIKTIVTAEGVTHQLDPSLDWMKEFIPIILPYIWKNTTWDQKMELIASLPGQFEVDEPFIKAVIPVIWSHSDWEEKTKILAILMGKLEAGNLAAIEGFQGLAEAARGAEQGAQAGVMQGITAAVPGLLATFNQLLSAGPVSTDQIQAEMRRANGLANMLAQIKQVFPEIFPEVWKATSAEDRQALVGHLLTNPSYSTAEISVYVKLLIQHSSPEELTNLYLGLMGDNETANKLFEWIEMSGLEPQVLKRQVLLLFGASEEGGTGRLQAQLNRPEIQQRLFPVLFQTVWPVMNQEERLELFRRAAVLFNTKQLRPVLSRAVGQLWPQMSNDEKVQMISASLSLAFHFPALTASLAGAFWRQTSLSDKFRLVGRTFIYMLSGAGRRKEVEVPEGEAPLPPEEEAAVLPVPASIGTGYYQAAYDHTPVSPSPERYRDLEALLDERVETLDDIEMVRSLLEEFSPLGRFLVRGQKERDIPLTMDMGSNAFGNMFDNLFDRNNKRVLWIGFSPGLSVRQVLHHVIHELVHSLPLIEGIEYPQFTAAEIQAATEDELADRILDTYAREEALAFSSNIQLYDELLSRFPQPEDEGKEVGWEDVWRPGTGEGGKVGAGVIRLWKKTIEEEGFEGFVAKIRQHYPPFDPDFPEGSYDAAARETAHALKENQDDLAGLEDKNWARKSKLAKKLRALNKLSAVSALLRAVQNPGQKPLMDKETLRRLSRTDELDKFVSDMVDDLEPEDFPQLVEILPMDRVVPGPMADLLRQVAGSSAAQDVLGKLAPLNQPATREAAKSLVVSETRKALNIILGKTGDAPIEETLQSALANAPRSMSLSLGPTGLNAQFDEPETPESSGASLGTGAKGLAFLTDVSEVGEIIRLLENDGGDTEAALNRVEEIYRESYRARLEQIGREIKQGEDDYLEALRKTDDIIAEILSGKAQREFEKQFDFLMRQNIVSYESVAELFRSLQVFVIVGTGEVMDAALGRVQEKIKQENLQSVGNRLDVSIKHELSLVANGPHRRLPFGTTYDRQHPELIELLKEVLHSSGDVTDVLDSPIHILHGTGKAPGRGVLSGWPVPVIPWLFKTGKPLEKSRYYAVTTSEIGITPGKNQSNLHLIFALVNQLNNAQAKELALKAVLLMMLVLPEFEKELDEAMGKQKGKIAGDPALLLQDFLSRKNMGYLAPWFALGPDGSLSLQVSSFIASLVGEEAAKEKVQVAA